MSYRVTLAASGHQFDVNDGETVLDAALRQGHVLPYSCRSGTCGTCKARLVDGEVDYGEYQDGALSEAEKESGLVLLCQAQPRGELVVEAREVETAQSIVIRTLPCRVSGLALLTHDVMCLSLQLPKNQKFNYLPGQYVDLLLRDGRRRSFSMATPANEDNRIELHVRRVPDGFFTNHVFTEMKERDLLRLQGPLGTFFLRPDSDRRVLLMAGGTGFAPIQAIVEDALRRGMDRPMHLFWGVRDTRDIYHQQLIDRWRREARFEATIVLSEPTAAWDGETGWVHEALVRAYPELGPCEVYASGPPPMIEAARPVFQARGLAEERFFYDSFEFSYDVARS